MPPMRSYFPLSLFLVLAVPAACSSPATTSGGPGGAGGTASGTNSTSGTGGTSSTTGTTSSGGGSGTTTTTTTATTGTTSSGGGSNYSCQVKADGMDYCSQYDNLTSSELTAEMSGCTSMAGTSGTACPTANAIGTCTGTAGGVTGITTWYSDGAETAMEAQISCESVGGMWTPG
jgi:hypothetical protein